MYVPPNAQPPESIPAIPPLAALQMRPVYAGFWLRAVAFLIDSVIFGLLFAMVIISNPSAFLINPDLNALPPKMPPQFTPLGIFVLYSFQIAMWLYFAFFEASAWQATPGKRILRICVTDLHGHRLTLSRALVRNLAKIISEFLAAGYIVAGFTEKKQALHDIIAKCLVIRRQ